VSDKMTVDEANDILGMYAALEAECDAADFGPYDDGDASDWWRDQNLPDLCRRLAGAYLRAEGDAKVMTQEVKRLMGQMRVSLGVGSGRGNLFVHGDFDSIHEVQRKLLEREELRCEVERLREEIDRMNEEAENEAYLRNDYAYEDA
jgi:hypothetical protein